MHGGFCQFTISSVRTTDDYRETGQIIHSRVALRGFEYYRQNALISDICDIHCVHPKLCHRLHHDHLGSRVAGSQQYSDITMRRHRMSKDHPKDFHVVTFSPLPNDRHKVKILIIRA
jgi:hypothetical protein